MIGRIVAVLALLLLAVAANWPRLSDAPATSYPAFDRQGGVAIAADPFDTKDKLAQAFPKLRVQKAGLLPLRLIITNNSDRAADLRRAQIVLMLANRTRLVPVPREDVEREILGRQPGHIRPRVGLPLPSRGRMRAHHDEEEEEGLETRWLKTRLIPPGTTEAGFFFFDASGLQDPLKNATLYVSNIFLGTDSRPLFYFEIHNLKH